MKQCPRFSSPQRRHWLTQYYWHILIMEYLYPSPQMPLIWPLVQSSSNTLTTPGSHWHFSAKATTLYSTFDRELLALYLGVKHFRHFLEGRQFTAYTDHKPLTFCMAICLDTWSNRQQCHISYISEFTTDIRHIQGKEKYVADSLSRVAFDSILLGIDYSAWLFPKL